VRKGIITHEEYEEVVQGMVRDIDNKIEDSVRTQLGADGE
jgi:hypothetical protein